MEFEWDSKKAISNLKKHGVDFADAIAVLEDERAITIPDDCPMRSASLQSVWTFLAAFSWLSMLGAKSGFVSYLRGKQQQKK